MNKILIIMWTVSMLLLLNSCVDNDFEDIDILSSEYTGEAANISIKNLKKIYTDAFPYTPDRLLENQFVIIEEELIFEGYVVSNDEQGNFYKNLVIQGSAVGLSEGIVVQLGVNSLYTQYEVGQKVFVNCKGLLLGKYGGEVQIGGGKYFYKNREWRLSPIALPSVKYHVFKDSDPIEITPPVRKISELSSDDLFTLLTLENVQFVVAQGQSWANVDNDHSDVFPFKTTVIEDKDGNTLDVFTSDYAKFGYMHTPGGSGSITGVLSAHKGNYQFIVSSLDDVNMDGERLDQQSGVFKLVESLDFDFQGLQDQKTLAMEGWFNISEIGTRPWISKIYREEVYAQASGYMSNDNEIVSWLITPAVNSSTQKYLSLETSKAYWAHSSGKHPLEILYSVDFDGTNYKTATWIVLDVNIAQKEDPDHSWIPSGKVALPIGDYVSVAFKYCGSKDETTTYRLDNIKITE